jgi:phosphatidylinositol alpha-1,6-mannosyltransferase
MRICLLSDTYPPDVGGLAIAAARLAGQLAAAGHTVHVCVRHGGLPPGEVQLAAENGVTVHRLGAHKKARDTFTDWFELAAALDEQVGFDLFHGYFVAYAGFLAAYLARYRGKKSVVGARGNDLDRLIFDAERAPYILKALEWASAVTVVSQDLGGKVAALSGRRDAVYIPNGVDAEFFRPAPPDEPLRAQLELGAEPVLGFVGEARAKKGLAGLLRAFARLAAELPLQLLMVGGVRPDDEPLLTLFQRQNPDLRLRLVPYQPQETLPAYYNLIDLLLLPSLRDGLPNALLEAMACGRPVVASAVGGIPAAIEDGVDGWLVPPRDLEALVARAREALDDEAARQRVGQAARAKVLAHYTTQQELAHYLALYRRLLDRGLVAA